MNLRLSGIPCEHTEMAAKRSAGILLFRFRNAELEVLLAHPGGPFWAKKDAGAWSIPKGEYEESEDPLTAAKREFAEETGVTLDGEFLDLGEVKQAGGKLVRVWALERDLDPASVKSNTFQMEWPPRSGRVQEFPEIDRAGWFALPEAQQKLLTAQQQFLNRLARSLEQTQ